MKHMSSLFALPILLPFLSLQADPAKPFIYGSASGNGNTIQAALKWTSDQDGTTPSSVTPWSPNAGDYRYVILSCSKFNRTSAFPDVPVYFGADGANGKYQIGEKESKFVSYNWNGYGVELTFPKAYFLFGRILSNGKGTTVVKGQWTFLRDGKDRRIEFVPSSIDFGETRGFTYAGKYQSEGDVTAYLRGTPFAKKEETDQLGYPHFYFTGDFSAYKGRFHIAKCLSYNDVRLESPTAMGCTAFPRSDAFVLEDQTRLTMTDEVIQSEARQITLSLGADESVALNADENQKWSLRTPLVGTKGRLEKIGKGTILMESSIALSKLEVKEGTLILTDTFSAPEHLEITVAAGANLLSTRADFLDQIQLNCLEGGKVGIYVEYDPQANETQPLTFTNANFAVLQGAPLSVMLSAPQKLPFHATNRLEIFRTPASAGVVAEDLADVTEKPSGLPYVWFEMEEQQETNVFYYVARPVIFQESFNDSRDYRNQYVMGTANEILNPDKSIFGYVWSDHRAAHAGADYVVDSVYAKKYGKVVCEFNGFGIYSAGGWVGRTAFPGESLTLLNGDLYERSSIENISYLRLNPGSAIYSYGCVLGKGMNRLRGTIDCRGSFKNPSRLVGSKDTSGDNPARYRWTTIALEGELIGDGWLQMDGDANHDFAIKGTNSNYRGCFKMNPKLLSQPNDQAVQIGHPHSLGGPLPAFRQDAFSVLQDYCGLCPKTTMTLDTENRGIYFARRTDFFRTPEGVELTLRMPLQAVNGFRKTGPGTLALGGRISFGGDGNAQPDGQVNRLSVEEGWVKAASKTGAADLSISFAEGTGIEVDLLPKDPEVAAFGLYLTRENALLSNGGTIAVRFSGTDSYQPKNERFAICTVPVAVADTVRGKFALPRSSWSGYHWKVEEDVPQEGFVRFRAANKKSGFTIFLR